MYVKWAYTVREHDVNIREIIVSGKLEQINQGYFLIQCIFEMSRPINDTSWNAWYVAMLHLVMMMMGIEQFAVIVQAHFPMGTVDISTPFELCRPLNWLSLLYHLLQYLWDCVKYPYSVFTTVSL